MTDHRHHLLPEILEMQSRKRRRSILPGMTVDADPLTLLVIDVLDEDSGLADVQDAQGRTFQLPAEWLPGAADGAAYRVSAGGGTVSFTPDPAGARLLREQSKQTLLDFADQPGAAPLSPSRSSRTDRTSEEGA